MKLTTLIIMLGAVSASLLFATMAVLIFVEFPAQQDKLLKQGGWALAENLRQQVEPMILTDERLQLDEAVTMAKLSDKNIDYIFILNEDKQPLASTFSKGVPKILIDFIGQKTRGKFAKTFSEGGKSQLHMSMALMDGDLGSLHIGMNREPILAFTNISLLKLSIVFLIMTVAALITAILVGRGVGRPLNQIATALKKTSGRWPRLDHIDAGPTLEVREFVTIFKQMINELEQTEQKRQIYEQKLLATERMASIGQLAAEVAHEINNPLDGLIEITRYLDQIGENPEKARKYLPLMRQGLEQIERIGRKLLRFAHKDSEDYAEVFNVCTVINDTVALLNGSMKKRGVIVGISGRRRCIAVGNAVATGQAVMNLLLNAADAMADEGGNINIDVSSDNGEVLIAVEDKGPGVSEEISETF